MNEIIFFKDKKGCPPLEWLEKIPKKAFAKGYVRLKRLEELGHRLTRPEADYLRDKIYELRWRLQTVNYRILYGFNGKQIIILLQGLTKEKTVHEKDIELAMKRLENFKKDPKKHSYKEDLE